MWWVLVFVLMSTACQVLFPLAGDAGSDASNANANRVFVTSTLHDGAFGGLSGADAICGARAGEANLDGTFVAWISTAGTNAIDRLSGSRGWVRMDGEPVAEEPSELTTQGPRVPLGITELGQDVRTGTNLAWTGTGSDGTVASNRNCANWTVDAGQQGRPGGISRGGGGFTTAKDGEPCGQELRLYCFEIGKQVTLVPNRVEGPVMFVSSNTWNANGIDVADGMCASEANNAELPGVFRAALAGVSTQARDRFPVADHDYVRVDGVRLGRVLVAPLPVGFANLDAKGALVPSDAEVFVGAGNNETGVNDTTCTNWTASATATVGSPFASDAEMFERGVPASCTQSRHVYCLQE